jgi:outer membrane protein insertion porin family
MKQTTCHFLGLKQLWMLRVIKRNALSESILVLLVLFSGIAHGQVPGAIMDYAAAKEYELGGVTIEGTKYLDEKILLTLAGLRVGDNLKVPGEPISKAIKNLWRQRLFTSVTIETEQIVGNKIYLKIKLEERAKLSKYFLKGIKNGDAEEIRKKLDIRVGSIFTESQENVSVNTIRDFYIEKGFLNTTVDVRQVPDPLFPNSIKVEFWVSKGQRVKINHINFYGTSAVSEGKLRSQMKETREKVKFDLEEMFRFKKNMRDTTFKWYKIADISPIKIYHYVDRFVNLNIFKASKFKSKEYEGDKQKLLEYYYSKGYRDAKIISDTMYQTDSRNLSIDIRIDEGRQYYFRHIFFNGNTKYPDSLLSRIVNIRKGDVYNQRELDEKLYSSPNGGDISSLYMDDGYLFFSVTPMEVRVDGDSIDLELRFNEGPQATIREVRIIGNNKTNERVIRRELYTLPGNKFSRADLIRSQRQITQLGYFDPQQLDMVPIPNPEKGTVDIEYRVTEKPSDQLELSAGWGGRQTNGGAGGLVGTLGLTFTNFSLRNIIDKKAWSPLPSGDGQRLSIRLQSTGQSSQFYTVSFTEPWLGGKKPNAFTVSFNRTRLNSFDADGKIAGHYIATAGTIALGTRLKKPDNYFTVEAALSYQRYDLKNYVNSFFIFSEGSSNNLSASFNISRNSVDAPLYPTRGSHFDLTVSASLPYSLMFKNRKNLDYNTASNSDKYKWIEFHKWKFTAEWYLSIAKNLVLKTSAKLGFLGYYNPRIGVSPFERFEIGGDGISNSQILGRDILSLRGYPVISPEGGAPIFNKYTVELRYPISLNPSATVYVLGFLEGGNYWMSMKDYRPYDLKRSVGAGVRVFLPMFGLLGFDYGIGWDRAPKAGNNIFSKYGEFRIILGFEPQ